MPEKITLESLAVSIKPLQLAVELINLKLKGHQQLVDPIVKNEGYND